MSSSPTLIEPGVKYFFNQTLKQCNVKRNNLYNTLCNLGLFAAFLGIFLSILYYKKKAKKTAAELEEEEQQKLLKMHVRHAPNAAVFIASNKRSKLQHMGLHA